MGTISGRGTLYKLKTKFILLPVACKAPSSFVRLAAMEEIWILIKCSLSLPALPHHHVPHHHVCHTNMSHVCVCCSLCLEHRFPRYSHGWSLLHLQVSAHVTSSEKHFLIYPISFLPSTRTPQSLPHQLYFPHDTSPNDIMLICFKSISPTST